VDGDRTEFLGRNGAPDRPAGLISGYRLQGAAGARYGSVRPPSADQLPSSANGAQTQVLVLLARRNGAAAAADLIRPGERPDHEATLRGGGELLGTIPRALSRLRTPDRSMEFMLNRWLIYQTLGMPAWARTAFYQAGGASGSATSSRTSSPLVISKRDLAGSIS